MTAILTVAPPRLLDPLQYPPHEAGGRWYRHVFTVRCLHTGMRPYRMYLHCVERPIPIANAAYARQRDQYLSWHQAEWERGRPCDCPFPVADYLAAYEQAR